MAPKRSAADMDMDNDDQLAEAVQEEALGFAVDTYSDDDEVPRPGRQLLPVASLPASFNGEPIDGLQYLFTVRRESHRLPHITRVTNPYELRPASATPLQNNDASARVSHLPSTQWRRTFETRFRNYRKNIPQAEELGSGMKQLPDKRDRDKWWQFLKGAPESVWNPPKRPKVDKERRRQHGRDQPRDDGLGPWTPVNPPVTAVTDPAPMDVTHDEYNEYGQSSVNGYSRAFAVPESYSVSTSSLNVTTTTVGTFSASSLVEADPSSWKSPNPTPSLLREIDSKYAIHLLMYFAYWINLHIEHDEEHKSSAVTPASSSCAITEHHLLWIFTLLARVEDTPSADDTAQLRSLVRGCVGLIKTADRAQPMLQGDDVTKIETGDVVVAQAGSAGLKTTAFTAACWMIVGAVTSVWAQHDLWQDAEDALAALP